MSWIWITAITYILRGDQYSLIHFIFSLQINLTYQTFSSLINS